MFGGFGLPINACQLLGEYKGAFTHDLGVQRILVGWQPTLTLLSDAPRFGEEPQVADFEQSQTNPVLVLFPFATNMAQRPNVVIQLDNKTAHIQTQKNLFAAGAAVLNHPFWLGVFTQDCAFDFVLSKK